MRESLVAPKKILDDIIGIAVEGRGSQLDELEFEEDNLIFAGRESDEQHQNHAKDVVPRRKSAPSTGEGIEIVGGKGPISRSRRATVAMTGGTDNEVETVVVGDDSRSGFESVSLRPKEGVDSRRESAPGAYMESVSESESNAEVLSRNMGLSQRHDSTVSERLPRRGFRNPP